MANSSILDLESPVSKCLANSGDAIPEFPPDIAPEGPPVYVLKHHCYSGAWGPMTIFDTDVGAKVTLHYFIQRTGVYDFSYADRRPEHFTFDIAGAQGTIVRENVLNISAIG